MWKGGVIRIRLDEEHYEIAHRCEVNTGSCCLFPSGFTFDESMSAYYENVRSYSFLEFLTSSEIPNRE